MLSIVFFLLLGLVAASTQQLDCPPVRIFVARASLEPSGTGMIGAVARSVQAVIPSSDIKAVDYPANLSPYVPSQVRGVIALTRMVNNFADRCPDSKMVLMGYSQGAHVVADVLCGASEKGFPRTRPLSLQIADKVSAVVLMGDPSHITNQPYNEGSSQSDGIFPRRNPAGCDAVASKMISFCDAGDKFCDGKASLAVHLGYVKRYGGVAGDFVVHKTNVDK